MASSTSLASDEVTETHPLALTTQFAPPADRACSMWEITTDDLSVHENFKSQYFYSGPGNAGFDACQPSGWAARPEPQRFSFSPAVCPSGWTWHRIGLVSVTEGGNHNMTTALCCAASFTPGGNFNSRHGGYRDSCMLDFGLNPSTVMTTTVPLVAGGVTTVTSGTFMHEAWRITWRETDQAVLTPIPPSMTGGTTLIFSWDGKATSIPDRDASTDNGSEHGYDGTLVLCLAIMLPICFAIGIGGLVYWICSSKKKKKKKENETYQATTSTHIK